MKYVSFFFDRLKHDHGSERQSFELDLEDNELFVFAQGFVGKHGKHGSPESHPSPDKGGRRQQQRTYASVVTGQ